MDMRKMMMLVEGDVVSLGDVKQAKTKEKIGGLVDGFSAYLAKLEAYKSEFGRYQPMLDEYMSEPGPVQVPKFFISIVFDGVADKRKKAALTKAGFLVMSDDPDWGTNIHDEEGSGSWSHGSYGFGGKAKEKNWYTQSSAEREVTKEQAAALFARRTDPETVKLYGAYRGADIHYHKGNLIGSAKTGWDIKSHPDYASQFSQGRAFSIQIRAEGYSQDAIIDTEANMKEALRVTDAIQHAENIRLSGATNVVSPSFGR